MTQKQALSIIKNNIKNSPETKQALDFIKEELNNLNIMRNYTRVGFGIANMIILEDNPDFEKATKFASKRD